MPSDSPEVLGKIVVEEVERAFADALESFIATFSPGLALQPLTVIAAVVSTAGQEFFFDLAKNLRSIPARVIARLALAAAVSEDSTRVVTLRDAKLFAASLVANAVWELAGGGPPGLANVAARVSAVKGLRKRLIAREEKQILGRVLHKVLVVVRAPVVFALKLAMLLWNVVVGIMAIGAAIALWNVVKSEWGSVALSQKHPRKFVREKIYKRL